MKDRVESESYHIEDAEQAIKDAKLILNLVKSKVGQGSGH